MKTYKVVGIPFFEPFFDDKTQGYGIDLATLERMTSRELKKIVESSRIANFPITWEKITWPQRPTSGYVPLT